MAHDNVLACPLLSTVLGVVERHVQAMKSHLMRQGPAVKGLSVLK